MSIVIVGAGHAGTQLAASLRDEGFAGDITLVSADADHPYHKPPLSKTYLKSDDAPLQPLRAAKFFDDQRIDLRLGVSVDGVDPDARQARLSDGAVLDYDHLILATGTRARMLRLPGHDLAGVRTLRTALDARGLRNDLAGVSRVAVIGGGFIGLEAAAMLAGQGVEVTVIELAPRLLGRAASASMAQAVDQGLRAMGVTVLTGATIERLEGDAGRISAVRLADGTVPADLCLVGIGAEPVVELAQDIGLDLDNGIAVDGTLKTSVSGIYAVGDCAAFPHPATGLRTRLESVQNATDQARALAKTLTGTPTTYGDLPWFWSDIGAMKLQIAGIVAEADAYIETRDAQGTLKSVYHLAHGRLVAVETINSAAEHMLARRMIADGVTPPRELMEMGDPRALKAAYQQATALEVAQ